MFSSFPAVPNPFSVPRFFRRASKSITLPSVEVHSIETNTDKRARTLKHLLKLNHAQHSIIYHNLQFHNHLPHILGSAYILQGSPDHLQEIYEADSKNLEPWTDSPHEISDYDWRDYLGDPHYQRAYVDFFEDQLVQSGYDWKGVLKKYLFEGKEPLFNNLISGLGHPLIHLGYAYELSSRELAMESLGLSTCFYNFLHRYLDTPIYTRSPHKLSPGWVAISSETDTRQILNRMAGDPRFGSLAREPGAIGMKELFADKELESAVLDHWNSWDMCAGDPADHFQEAQATVVALLVGSHYPPEPEAKEYDFFLVHLLTTSHAVRILLPLIEPEWHVPLVRQWWLFVCAVFVMQGRPGIDEGRFTGRELGEGQDWEWVRRQAVEGKWRCDEHFVKALRAMMVAGQTWGDGERTHEGKRREEFYLKAAVLMAEEYGGWGGFGAVGVEEGVGAHESKEA